MCVYMAPGGTHSQKRNHNPGWCVGVCMHELGGIQGTVQLEIRNQMEEELHLSPKKLPGLHFQRKSPLPPILRAPPILTLLQAKETETHATM